MDFTGFLEMIDTHQRTGVPLLPEDVQAAGRYERLGYVSRSGDGSLYRLTSKGERELADFRKLVGDVFVKGTSNYTSVHGF